MYNLSSTNMRTCADIHVSYCRIYRDIYNNGKYPKEKAEAAEKAYQDAIIEAGRRNSFIYPSKSKAEASN